MKNKDFQRGTLYLTLSQILFLLAGFLLHIILARMLGKVLFGQWGVIISLLVWVEVATTSGITYIATKILAESRDYSARLIRRLYLSQLLASLLFLLFFLVLIPLIALLLKDRSLIFYLRIAAIDIPFYGLYSMAVAMLGGQRRFLKQSLVLTSYSLLKLLLIPSLAYSYLGLTGALIGNILVSLLAFIIGFDKAIFKQLFTRYPVTEKISLQPALVKVFGLALPFTIFGLTSSLLSDFDLWFVKAIVREGASVGIYNAAHTLAKIPYFLSFGFSLALFPTVASFYKKKPIKDWATFVNQSLKLALWLYCFLIAISWATANSAITLVYSSSYIAAASYFGILMTAISVNSIFWITTSVMQATDRIWLATASTGGLITLTFVLNLNLTPRFGLMGAALSVLITGLMAFIGALFYLYQKLSLSFSGNLLRVGTASLLTFILGWFIPKSVFLLPVIYLVLGGIYLLLLILFRETTKEELLTIWSSLIPWQKEGLIPSSTPKTINSSHR